MKLKNCPFCNGEAEIETVEYSSKPKLVFIVYCTDCGLTKSDLYGPKEKAIKYWNTRTGEK